MADYDKMESRMGEWFEWHPNHTSMSLKGWNLDTKKCLEVMNEIITDEFSQEDSDKYEIEILNKTEMGFSCSRFFEGQEASDEGYGFWLEYHKEYKRGLGKCTVFDIIVKDLNDMTKR